MFDTRSTLLIALTFAHSCYGQITYRRRSSSLSRIIAGCIVGGLALITLICLFAIFARRRRRGMQYRIAAIPRPHAGDPPFQLPQHNQPIGAPPVINGGPTPYQYPQQAHYGPKEPVQIPENPPAYTKEQDFLNNSPAPNNPPQSPNAAHIAPPQNDDRFVGGFRPQQ